MLYQATCVAIDGRAVLIEGPPGSGKTSLALALIDRGARLVGDDGVLLELHEDGRAWASPAPRIRGKIEIRNVGIAEIEPVNAPLALILGLDVSAPRFVETAPSREILGVDIPVLAFSPLGPVGALRAEYALRLHGLD
ncbi:MAG: serine kinase [Erythrobacter sp.]|jgi:HPr kinase/phosphorylase|nr:serine kinase [Erythrobacter sp.]RZV35969.1 MAG: serine kinase [Sphingomonadaceae bacterium]